MDLGAIVELLVRRELVFRDANFGRVLALKPVVENVVFHVAVGVALIRWSVRRREANGRLGKKN
jgi:hypothetical protein